MFCKEHIAYVDYKDYNMLRRFTSDRGKIRARRVTALCPQHQREAAVAIKRAREMALLPYVVGREGVCGAGNTDPGCREERAARAHRGGEPALRARPPRASRARRCGAPGQAG